MNVLTLPKTSKLFVVLCFGIQVWATHAVFSRQNRSIWLSIAAFFVGGFITDLISSIFHFSFDYVWPPKTPIMGPIAVEFREHHEEPTLDPSALATNLTKGAYGALPLALITLAVTAFLGDSSVCFLLCASLLATSLWMIGFHQIHAYAHMGSSLPPEEFNRAVTEISQLPAGRQKREFARLFDRVGIPGHIRFLQHCRLFLRPELHWRHHNSFETDFSSVNGWSDPVTNWLFRRLVQHFRVRETARVTDSLGSRVSPLE